MSALPEKSDVLIIGAGPTGLSLAIMLRRLGVDVCVVDKLPGRLPWSRALGLHARTLEILDALGVLEAVRERSLVQKAVQVHNEQGPLFRLDLSRLEAPFPWVLSCPQAELEACLEARLNALGGRVCRDTELMEFHQDAEGVNARLNDGTAWHALRCRMLVGCDGARSLVREQLGLGFHGVEYPDHFLLADVDIDWALDGETSHGFLLPEGALIALPMPQGWRLILNQRHDEDGQAGEPSLEAFRTRLRQALGEVPPLDNVRWLSRFSIHRRLVTHYRRNRVLLAGDACHVQSPLGAQGMNTGIAEAFNLGWKLALYLDGIGGGPLLDSYEQERRPVARNMLYSVDLLSKTSFARNRILRGARDSFLKLVTRREAVGRRLVRRASQLDVNYRHSPLVDSGPGGRGLTGPRPGDRMPDARLSWPDGVMGQRLQGLLQVPRHHLIVYLSRGSSHSGRVTVYALADRMLSEFGGCLSMLAVVPAPVDPQLGDLADFGVQVLVDRHHEFERHYGEDAGLWLMRPDGHLAWRGSLESAEQLLDFLRRCFRRR